MYSQVIQIIGLLVGLFGVINAIVKYKKTKDKIWLANIVTFIFVIIVFLFNYMNIK